ncbi:hypothetical protein [Hymenobacter sp. PAMC 26628]|nr:hypothetical protein [Hymenobacter sp. PAMC 26628]
MKKTTTISSLLLLGGFGLLAARLRSLNLHFSLHGEDAAHYG